MKKLPIILVPNPILKRKAQKVTDFGPALSTLAQDMLITMRTNNGMGLAAPQIGIGKRLLVMEYEPADSTETAIPPTIVVNPKVISTGTKTEWLEEGCLSIPGAEVPVIRPTEVTVLAQNLKGERVKIRAKNLQARILQHEIDHLNGVLVTDRAYPKLKDLAGLRVVFMGTPSHSIGYLTALTATDLKIVGVITETDKTAGRQRKLTETPVKQFAKQLGIPVFQFDSLKNSVACKQFSKLKPDLVVVVAYGKIIPDSWLSIPKHGFINVHYSLLPKLRGPSPHQSAILNGLEETGYTIFKLENGIDTGPIITQKKVKIESNETSQSLLEKMSLQSIGTLLEILPDYVEGRKKTREQDHNLASTTSLIAKTHGLIDWSLPIQQLDRQIRAYQGWPIAYTLINDQRVLIHLCHLENGLLAIDAIQPAGKSVMSFADFLNGDRVNRLTFFQKLGKVKLK